ncbi:MAG TPA: MFS transporter [Desulfatiglandales bacterium]|nr:MFS transporter [Desulfatiglandales bacterium]
MKKVSMADFYYFFAAIFISGFSFAIVNTIFNNFLDETFVLSGLQRGMLELPRELPGFLVIFFSALLYFLCTRRLAALSHILAAVGIFLIGHLSTSYGVMLIWLFIHSIGQHIFLPLISGIGMEFAKEGNIGKRLGQLNSAGNIAGIIGSFMVFIGFRFLHFDFPLSFTIAAAGMLISAFLLYAMRPDELHPEHSKFTMRREYGLYYWLCILYGTRKQIFITFAPWVLVTVFHKSTAMLATLMTVGGVIGIFFNLLLGRAIDRLGERFILMSEAFLLVFICIGYGFSRVFLPEKQAFLLAAGCFIIDQLLMAAGMARATYLKKIALRPEDVNQTLSMGVSIDHIFSISLALLSGYIWKALGYQYVFLLGSIIAVANLISASRIKIKRGML